MKVKELLFICLFASSLLFHSEAYISINIDPEDFDQVSDFLHTIMINEQPQSMMQTRKNYLLKSLLKKSIYGSIQLLGVMITLIGANVISTILIPEVPVVQDKQQEIIFQNQNDSNISNLKYSEMCNIDFGCNRNLCWKSCNTIVDGKNLWCYTSPKAHAGGIRDFHHCIDMDDCSICWDCIEPCHT